MQGGTVVCKWPTAVCGWPRALARWKSTVSHARSAEVDEHHLTRTTDEFAGRGEASPPFPLHLGTPGPGRDACAEVIYTDTLHFCAPEQGVAADDLCLWCGLRVSSKLSSVRDWPPGVRSCEMLNNVNSEMHSLDTYLYPPWLPNALASQIAEEREHS